MTTEKKYEDMKMLVIVLLVLNVLLGIYIAFFKRDAYRLETLKVGGATNMSMATQLYKSPVYVQQQKTTLEQILGSMNAPTVAQPEVAQPEVIQPEAVQPTPAQ